MADLVGEAFIRITADTHAMHQAVRRAAKESAQEYTSVFGKEVERTADRNLARARQQLAEGLADPKAFNAMAKKFETTGDAANNFRKQLVELREQGDLNKKEFDRFTAAVNRWQKQTERAAKVAEEEAEAQRKAGQAISDRDKALRQFFITQDENLALQRKALRESEKLRKAEEKRIAASNKAYNSYAKNIKFALTREERALLENEKVWESYSKNITAAAKKREKAILDEDRAFHTYASNIRTSLEKDAEPGFLRLFQKMDLFGDRVAIIGDRVGRVFGKGARNNFFNLFGRSIDGLIAGPIRGLIEGLSKAGEFAGEMVAQFRLAQSTGAGVFTAGLQTLAGAVTNLIPLLIGLAVGLTAILALAPVLASALSVLAGALTAVAGALTVAIAGAIAAILPLVLPVVASIGLLVNLFIQLKDESSAASKAMKTASTAFKDFQKDIEGGTTKIAEALGAVAPGLLTLITPFTQAVATAMANIIKDFGKVMSDPAVQQFFEVFTTTLPGAFESIGKGFNDAFVGILGLLSALSPFAVRLADGFEALMQRFADFTKSAEGQNSIKSWMDTAFEAAKSLWEILGNLTSIIGKVFTAATEGAGQSFLDYLVNVTDKFDAWLSTAEGQNEVKAFFEDVRDAMVTVKDIIEDIARAFDNLDSDDARAKFEGVLDIVEKITSIVETISTWTKIIESATLPILHVIDGLKAFQEIVSNWAAGPFTDFLNSVGDGLSAVVDWFQQLPETIGNGFAVVGQFFADLFTAVNTFLTNVINTVIGWGVSLRETLLTALLFIPSLIVELIGPATIQGWITTFQGWVAAAVTWVGNLYTTVRDFVVGIATGVGAWIAGAVSALTSAFQTAYNNVATWVSSLYNSVRDKITGIAAAVWGWISPIIATLSKAFLDAYNAAIAWVTDLYNDVRDTLGDIVSNARTWISGLVSAITDPFEDAYDGAVGWVDKIKSLFSGALQRARDTASSISNALPGGSPVRQAYGGILYGATDIRAGESGREAYVPLDKPLSMINPAVREIAAFAQGKVTTATGNGKTVNVAPGAVVISTAAQSPAVIRSMVYDGLADMLSSARV